MMPMLAAEAATGQRSSPSPSVVFACTQAVYGAHSASHFRLHTRTDETSVSLSWLSEVPAYRLKASIKCLSAKGIASVLPSMQACKARAELR